MKEMIDTVYAMTVRPERKYLRPYLHKKIVLNITAETNWNTVKPVLSGHSGNLVVPP